MKEKDEETIKLVAQAKLKLGEDMKSRDIAAIIWNIGEAGFHYIPEIVVGQDKNGVDIVKRITGLYVERDDVYAIEEGTPGTDITEFYTKGVDVPPIVITLTKDMAEKELGNPEKEPGFTRAGSGREWLTIADCYFEALNER